MDHRLRWRIRSALGRWLTLILCLTLLTSSSPLAVGAGAIRPGATNAREPAGAVKQQDTSVALDVQPQAPRPDAESAAASLPQGTVLGLVVNAEGDAPLAGVQVVASGVLDERPPYRVFLPLLLKKWRAGAAALPAPAAGLLASSIVLTTTTNADGSFSLAAPAGAYTLTFTRTGFGLDRRTAAVRANEISRVTDVRLHALDPVVVPVGAAGGKVTNSLGNTSLQFPAGAVAATQQARVTYLANDALPGYFADGSAPMGFAALEPEGLVFPPGKEVLWTVAYTGTLPIGTDTLCYWWDGKTNRWRDPVPGKVVDLGGGVKALQAKVHHFSAYGHALPGIAGQQPGGGTSTITTANAGQGGSQTNCPGCTINVGTGSVSEGYVFEPVSSRGLAVVLGLRYSSSNDTPTVTARVPFTITSQTPARAEWLVDFQGKTYTGAGYDARAEWDTRNGLGYRVAPGLYDFNAWETFYYDSGQQPTMAVSGTVEVRRGDLSPFGFNWLSSYDTLLVNRSSTVTIIQGDGQYLTYLRQADGSFKAPAGDYSTLTLNPDGAWVRRSKYGSKEFFNTLGRLVRIEDSNGNALNLAYEPNGTAPVAGRWSLTTRLVSITDSSGRSTSLAYGADGYVSSVTDAAGRTYTLSHDAAGNLTAITDPLNRTVTYRYDADHILTSFDYPDGGTTALAYQNTPSGEEFPGARIIKHTDALGNARTTTYTTGGASVTDELGNVTSYQYDAFGGLTRVVGGGRESVMTYDPSRQLKTSSPPSERYEYDSRGNVTGVSSYTSVHTAFEPKYNQPETLTDALGNVTRFSYDSSGNLIGVTDALGGKVEMRYDAYGQVIESTDPLGQTSRYEYDAAGNMTRIRDPLNAEATLGYDAAGNLTSFTDPEGRQTQHRYDVMDRRTQTTDAAGGVERWGFNKADSVTAYTDPRGNVTHFEYDLLGQLLKETDPLNRSVSYNYDAKGNLKQRTTADGAVAQFAFDALGRLTGEAYTGGETVEYAWDGADDLIRYVNGAATVIAGYSSGIPNAPDSVQTRLVAPNIQSEVTYDYAAPMPGTTASAREDTSPIPAAGGELAPPGEGAVTTGDPSNASPDAPAPEPAAAPASRAPRLEDLPAFPRTPAGVAINGCGSISTDTTWTVANSPYVLDGCSAYVDRGATLTIQPGVIVKFGSKWDMLQVNGRLLAQGAASQPILFTSLDDDTGGDTNGNGGATQPAPGDWNGVRFGETSTGSILDRVVVRYGGADGATSGIYSNIAAFVMSNSIIAQTKGHGIYLDATMPPTLTNNSIVSNTLTAATAILNESEPSITLSGNAAAGNGVNGFRVYGTFKGTGTWVGDPGLPFAVLDGNLQVQPGASLMVTPGTVFKLGSYVWDAVVVFGRFTAQGTVDRPITFTSIRDDSVAGDTNNDGSATAPAPGDWNGVVFRDTSSGSILDHAVVRYGGSYVNTAGVQANTGNFTLSNSTVALTKGYGLYMDGGVPPALRNNVFTGNTLAAVRAYFNTIGASIQLTGNQAAGNGANGFQVVGVLGADSTFAGQADFPFIIADGNLSVQAGAKLTLAAGTVVKVEHSFAMLAVYGALESQGTAGQLVYFTSLRDDTVGGDTNNDGRASQPAPGDWMQILFNNPSQQSTLNHTIIRYAGGTSWKLAIRDYTSALRLDGCTIAYTSGGGLGIEAASPTVQDTSFLDNERGVHTWAGAQPVLRGNRFVGNSLYGVLNDSPGVVLDATGSWWGGALGPLDTSDDRGSGGWYNPDGDGDKVSDRVRYEPWQIVTGLVYGVTIATGSNPIQTIRYEYDALARRTAITVAGPAAGRTEFKYDVAGQITSGGPPAGSPGVTTAYEYDAGGRITRLLQRWGASGPVLADLRYTFDKLGNIAGVTDGAGTTTYTYDAVYRITGMAGPAGAQSYSYDAAGNRIAQGGVNYTYDAANQLLSSSDGATYTYDADGKTTSVTRGGQKTTYTWNAAGKLVRIDFPDATYAAYTYDALGLRVSGRDRTGAVTYYVYEGSNLVQELDATGAVLASYVYDGTDHPIRMARSGQTYYYLHDLSGNVIGLADGAGNLVVSYRYDPWGNALATGGSQPGFPNPFRFVGREWDAESGLYFVRARYYDPQTGRFLSRDPVWTGNPYIYAENNPLNLKDPTGMRAGLVIGDALANLKMWEDIRYFLNAYPPGDIRHFYWRNYVFSCRDPETLKLARIVHQNFSSAGTTSEVMQHVNTWAGRAGSQMNRRIDLLGRMTQELIRHPPLRAPSFASFAKPPPSLLSRLAGSTALRWGGRAGLTALRFGGRALPVIGTALLIWDGVKLARWLMKRCP